MNNFVLLAHKMTQKASHSLTDKKLRMGLPHIRQTVKSLKKIGERT